MFLKKRNISSKIKRSKVTDYAALNLYLGLVEILFPQLQKDAYNFFFENTEGGGGSYEQGH